jgi:Protein of unknown function (DUF3298)
MRRILILGLLLFLSHGAMAQDKKIAPPDIVMEFPSVEGLQPFIESYKAEIRKEVMDDYNKAMAEDGIYNPWSLELNAHMTYQGPFWAMLVRGYDYRGGAHGMPFLEALYFDAESKKPMSQADLLKPESYEALSKLCRADLIKQDFAPDDEWMLKGTEPKAENFQVLVPSDEGLAIIFNSYQVAPYSAGNPTVMLPWSEVNEFFKPDFQRR